LLKLATFCVIVLSMTFIILSIERTKNMEYSYNKLWKMLIDKGMTKTDMRKRAGISTNILAKMGKGDPVSMESLAKIATTFNCGFDDIVDIYDEARK